MKTLWPYYSTKKKAFYRDGKKRLVITRINSTTYQIAGTIIPGKTIMWNTGETIFPSSLRLISAYIK